MDNRCRLKTEEERKAEEIKRAADEYAALSKEAVEIKARMEYLKGYFEKLALHDLKDTKRKTAEYWGSRNNHVTVNVSGTVKPVSITMIKELMGRISGDMIKTETIDKMTEPCKRFLTMIFQGNYTEGSLEETIRSITADPKIQATLKKRLKGRWEKDKALLMQVAGLTEQEACDWAYLAAEVINWEWMVQLLQAADWQGSIQQAIDIIKAAVIVDETLKVSLSAE